MTTDRLRQLIASFESKRILVIGDIMLDRFLWGNVSRISPEAPVPVVEVTRESSYPGGAANVARNLVPFCKSVSVLGIAGTGPDAVELLELLNQQSIDTTAVIQNKAHRTIVKTRVIAQSQQVVRIDHEERRQPSAEDISGVLVQLEARMDSLDAIILEDYAKGLITQELVDGIAALAEKHNVLITVDPNPKNPILWKAAAAIKPNRKEAFEAAGVVDPSGNVDDAMLGTLASSLFGKWGTEALLITMGDHGMALMERQSAEPYRIPTRAKEVFDVSGAGDTAIALFTLALTASATTREAAEVSNLASGVVVGKIGTATLTADELVAAAVGGVEPLS
ncbi:MAG: PfkB family carbohydrate kinase [Verrucomicrobiales bacterium]